MVTAPMGSYVERNEGLTEGTPNSSNEAHITRPTWTVTQSCAFVNPPVQCLLLAQSLNITLPTCKVNTNSKFLLLIL